MFVNADTVVMSQDEYAADIKLMNRMLDEISLLSKQFREAAEDRDELQASFDLRREADQRAIKRWQEANPGNDLTWPDHADLCVWLMEENDRLQNLINTPEIDDFLEGVKIEAAHQVERWGEKHDTNKSAEDWFWLVGYLAGKALHPQRDGNSEKHKHHLITTAAALFNWHKYYAQDLAVSNQSVSQET